MDDSADDWTAEGADNKYRRVRFSDDCAGEAEQQAKSQACGPARPWKLDAADDNTDGEAIHKRRAQRD